MTKKSFDTLISEAVESASKLQARLIRKGYAVNVIATVNAKGKFLYVSSVLTPPVLPKTFNGCTILNVQSSNLTLHPRGFNKSIKKVPPYQLCA
ncbi:MAG: hypothetical protein KGI54_05955 [Pseudomonadota bacterium]|nr:hypothetical protein [Pseudomonadota bacterium]